MALNGPNGFNAAATATTSASAYDELSPDLGSGGISADNSLLPIFNVESVQLQFSIAADFVAAQVANNVLVLALSNGRILRIDLNRPEDIDDIDLPKRVSEVGVIRRMFLDPTASHLLVCTSQGENYYLHTQSRHPRPLSRLRGVPVESVAWNPSNPTATTREILIGAADGNIYETFIETSNEFYRKEEKYLKVLHKLPDGAVTGLWADNMGGKTDIRRVVITTQNRVFHLVGKVGRVGHEGSGSIYTRLFDGEQPVVHELARGSAAAPSALAVSPDPPESTAHAHEDVLPDRAFAWLSSHGVYHGRLLTTPATNDVGNKVFADSKLLARPHVVASPDPPTRKRSASEFIDAIALTQWHIVCLIGDRIVAVNRLTGAQVFSQNALDPGEKALGLYVDQQKNTFWLFTSQKIFEIVVRDEDRDIWRVMLDRQQFDVALRYAHTLAQKDAVAIASGDHLTEKGLYVEAAGVYGRSSKPFEDVALAFIDNGQDDALRKYLLTKLTTYKKSATMQRTMIATWLVEVFMAKLNSLEDTITTEAELVENLDAAQSRSQLRTVQDEYREFVKRHKTDLDRRTTYDVISSHAREEELLFFANAVDDYNYVLAYWVQRERWREALDVLKRQTDPEVFYRYSSVLMTHKARELVEIMMRHPNLEPRRVIPALLDYNRAFSGPLNQNQAVRYLQFLINQVGTTDAAVHNTLVSVYASHPSRDESALLAYLESQGSLGGGDGGPTSGSGAADPPRYDPDFALRLCIQHRRTLSCVHIYTGMGQYPQAVDLALSHGEVELASMVADRPPGDSNRALRKKLWLKVARQVISSRHQQPSQAGGEKRTNGEAKEGGDGEEKPWSIRDAVSFLRRCADPELLRIEDLIPLFPDFAVIDDFRDDVCAQLEQYSRSIERLRREMDESAATSAHIRRDVSRLRERYAVVSPGERCRAGPGFCSGGPLLARQFFVFPCQHAFHADCLAREVLAAAGPARARRIRDLQVQVSKGLVEGARKEEKVRELDALVAGSW